MTNTDPLVSICMPHWQVKELVMLGLRAIRKHTTDIPYEVIVVDNESRDDSLDYLRRLPWIRLIERGSDVPENWVLAFITALDVGLANSRGKYFVIMHTDTIVKHPDWLRRTLLGNPGARPLTRELCPRDYCALYRSEPIRRLGLRFDCCHRFPGYTTGEQMYYQLKENGYRAEVIPTAEMMKYLLHLGHATAGLRPRERHLRHRRSQRKSEKRLRKLFDSDLARELAADSSLDR